MRRLLLVAVAAAFGVGAFADSNLIVNGSFEDKDFTGWTDGNEILANVSHSPTPTPAHLLAADGSYLAVFGGPSNDPDMISQAFSDTIGTTYDVSFYLGAGGATGGLDFTTVKWDGSTILAESAPQTPDGDNYSLTYYHFTETGTGSDSLSFTDYNNSFSFDGLDNVQVTPRGAPSTPGPAAVLPFALGLLRRRRAKAVGQ